MVTKNQLTALAIAGLIVAAVVIGSLVYYTLRIRGGGRIKLVGLKAYADPDCTQEVSAVDWGTIAPGGISQVTLYLKSTSTVPANLTLSTENWTPPAAAQYLTLTWDYDGSPFAPGEVRAVIFTLHVSEDVTGITEFAFDIVIVAAG